MKTLYLDCSMGAAGDMLMAALLELLPEQEGFVAKLNNLGIPGVKVIRENKVSNGITGTHLAVTVDGVEEDDHHHDHDHDHDHDHHHDHHHDHDHDHDHHHDHHHEHNHNHGTMEEIEAVIAALPVSDWVRSNALEVYKRIAEAESKVHGRPVSQVHFHEVGSMDAITDIVGVTMLVEELSPDRIVASPVCVGSGTVNCAHGVLPVPAPATALLLRGIPAYGSEFAGELCTPTGAALLGHFVSEFGAMPAMSISGVGYGLGKKEFPRANCLRAMVGRTAESGGANEQIAVLSCNLDDMTGEAIGFACQRLLELGALDVFTQPIAMKKSRPAQLLTCITATGEADRIAKEMLRYTTTFGVRRTDCSRYALSRRITTVETKYGSIRIKTGEGYGIEKLKPEYDDIAAAAAEHGLAIGEVLQEIGV